MVGRAVQGGFLTQAIVKVNPTRPIFPLQDVHLLFVSGDNAFAADEGQRGKPGRLQIRQIKGVGLPDLWQSYLGRLCLLLRQAQVGFGQVGQRDLIPLGRQGNGIMAGTAAYVQDGRWRRGKKLGQCPQGDGELGAMPL
jgi:hypothetical protein